MRCDDRAVYEEGQVAAFRTRIGVTKGREVNMPIPRFTAGSALYKSSLRYRSLSPTIVTGAVRPAGLFGASIDASWQLGCQADNPYCDPCGGQITVTGSGFNPNTTVYVSAENCTMDALATVLAKTGPSESFCYPGLFHPPWGFINICRDIGATFQATLTCQCGGASYVTAGDGSNFAATTVQLTPCPPDCG